MNSKSTGQEESRSAPLTKPPLFELLVSSLIVASHIFFGLMPRMVSDALFIEGMALSVVGGIIGCRISEALSLSHRVKDDQGSRSTLKERRGLRSSLFKRRTGFRMLLVGLILIAAAIVTGELSRPR